MKKYLFIILIAFSICKGIDFAPLAIDIQDSVIKVPKQSNIKNNLVYIELLGNGILGSINYERMSKNIQNFPSCYRIGFSWRKLDYYLDIITILELKKLYGKTNHYFVVGLGLEHGYILRKKHVGNRSNETSEILASFRLGYRYQSSTGKLFFNCGFTPFYHIYDWYWEIEKEDAKESGDQFKPWRLFPWIGIGIGISF